MKKWLLIVLAAALLSVLLLQPEAQLPAPSQKLIQASEGLYDIRISARLDAEKRSLHVVQELSLQNRSGQVLDAAVLRTWPNAFQNADHSPCAADEKRFAHYYPAGFSAGAFVMERASVNGETVVHRYLDEAKTVLNLPVPGGWEEGKPVQIMLEYTVQIPQMAYRFGVWDGVWTLGNAFAVPAVWENGAFRTDAYAPVGDPFVSDCANYTVDITVPKGYVCAGSGYSAVETADGEQVYRFDAKAVRDFALVISDRFHAVKETQNGVLISAYALEKAQAREMLKYAKRALECYESRYGAYPYQSYTLAQAHLVQEGMEFPLLSMIDAALKGRELEYVIAHEAAHQWWYGAVGSDGWNQPWQDEALCEFSLLEYAQSVYGPAEREDLERSRMESAMRVTVPQGVTPGAPLDTFASASEYTLVAIHRGAACLCALDRTVEGGLDGFLRDYYQNYAFLRASRQDFERQLALSTGEDLAPLLRDYLDTHLLN